MGVTEGTDGVPMATVALRFETRGDAYGFLSESRRLASTMLWEIIVEEAAHGWVVRVPVDVYRIDVTGDALDRFHGVVLGSAG